MISAQGKTWAPAATDTIKHTTLSRAVLSGAIVATLSKIAFDVWRYSPCKVIYLASLAFVGTSIVRIVFKDYTFCKKCQYAAIDLTNRVYGIQFVIGLVSAVFMRQLPVLCGMLALGLGILHGFTHEIMLVRSNKST